MVEAVISSELKNRVEEAVVDYICQAEARYGITIPCLPIGYRNMGRVAGQHVWRKSLLGADRHSLAFNSVLLAENEEDFMARTVPHEVAHYVASMVWGRVRSHGAEWQRVMRGFGLNPSRCHSYDTSASRKKVWRHVYSCDCREHRVSTVMHNKILRGSDRRCRACKARIRYTGKSVKV